MFRAMFSPILRSNVTVYTALVQCTDLLATGDTAELELPTVYFARKWYVLPNVKET
jgi:hypothetical protein